MSAGPSTTLYYIHDPMCSWCWGFKPVWHQLKQQLPENIDIKYVLGGLAEDSDEPMPEAMQQMLQQTWLNIQKKIPGTAFNFDFWSACQPRRSTYPACRAVIAATKQRPETETLMIEAIQQAYYLNAKNPSNDDSLIDLARDLKLNQKLFETDLNSEQTQQALQDDILLSQRLGAQGFPSLVLDNGGKSSLLRLDYNVAENMLQQIKTIIKNGSD